MSAVAWSTRAATLLLGALASLPAAHAATITLVPGAGFNDTTPVAPEGGNPGTTRGQQRTILFNAAAAVWAGKLSSPQTIKIQASFDTLACSAGSGVLGSAGATGWYGLFSGADERFFPVALAEAITGSDLNQSAGNTNEIRAQFNARVDLDDPACLGNTRFYYGLTGPAPAGTIALFPTLLHELGHGLGFQSLVCTSPGGCAETSPPTPYGGYFFGLPDIWADFLQDNTGSNTLWINMTNAQRVASFTNDPLLVWNGPTLAARTTELGLAGAQMNEGRLRMYAPSPFVPGSSIAHFTVDATPNLLMEPSLNADLFNGTDLTACLFDDIGWVQNDCVYNTAPVLDPTRSPALQAVDEDAPAASGAVGTPVSALVDFASPPGQVDNVIDPDPGAQLGIAVVGANTANGSWFFSTNSGANWNPLGSVSASSARLLAADAGTRLYFRPAADFNGTIGSAITFRAWDRTSGSNGGMADPGSGGGTSAFSSATDTVSIVVNPINDAPLLDASRSPVFTLVFEDAPPPSGADGTPVTSLADLVGGGGLDNVSDVDAGAQTGIAITGANAAGGTWFYTTDNGNTWLPLGNPSASNARLLSARPESRLYLSPGPDFEGNVANGITFRAWDRTSGSDGGTANPGAGGGTSAFSATSDTAAIQVLGINDAPQIGAPDQTSGDEDSIQSITITITDPDSPQATVDLGAGHGTLSLASIAGLAFQIGDGVADASMRFSGSLAAVNGALANVSYLPLPDYDANDMITLQASDGPAPPTNRTVPVTIAPVADVREDLIDAVGGTPRNFNVLTGSGGATADTFSGTAVLTAVSAAAHGSVEFLSDGSVTYIADETYSGSDSFEYTVASGESTEIGQVTIEVTAPVLDVFADGFEPQG